MRADDERKITCGKLVKGDVCYGELIELGSPDEKEECIVARSEVGKRIDDETIEVNGVKYQRID